MLRAIHDASFFGKLPSTLDFVRIHLDYPEAVQLDRWLTTGLQRLAAQGLSWPSEPLRFVFVPAASDTALLGAVTASNDRAGRAFPVAIFAAFTPATDLAALPLASARFLEQAEDLLERSALLSTADLKAALTRLHLPQASELRAAADRLQSELAALSLEAFARTLFAGAPAAALAAFERLLDAGTRTRDLVFDCPTDTHRDGAIWSRLAALSLGRAPSCLWNADAQPGRVLLAFGPLPERAPLYWAAKARKHAQLRAVAAADHERSSAAADVNGERPLATLFGELARRKR
jgi:type VI secretion system ImpM family protein